MDFMLRFYLWILPLHFSRDFLPGPMGLYTRTFDQTPYPKIVEILSTVFLLVLSTLTSWKIKDGFQNQYPISTPMKSVTAVMGKIFTVSVDTTRWPWISCLDFTFGFYHCILPEISYRGPWDYTHGLCPQICLLDLTQNFPSRPMDNTNGNHLHTIL